MSSADGEVRLPLDTPNVAYWLSAHGHDVREATVLAQFGAGQSNPTYLLQLEGVGGKKTKLVLRRKPPGELLPSAHDVVREYRVMDALQQTDVPVPRMRGLCTSDHVLGVPFYCMEYVEGRVLADERLPDCLPAERTAIWINAVRTLATLHSVDYRKVNLERHGKRGGGGYALRQLDVWSRQFRAVDGFVRAQTAGDAPLHAASDQMLALEAWLRGALAAHVGDTEPTCIVHGDFRLGNLMLEARTPRVAAVLDWEISTLGHPLSDLAYFLSAYRLPAAFGGLAGDAPPGTPSEAELLGEYAAVYGAPPAPARVRAFFTCLMWQRKAAIAHGVYARALQGNAAAADASRFGVAFREMVGLGIAAMRELQRQQEGEARAEQAAPPPASRL